MHGQQASSAGKEPGFYSPPLGPASSSLHRSSASPPARSETERARKLASFLGWFSIGLGVAQLLAPQKVSRTIGIPDRPGVMRAVGARELASGAGILLRGKPGWFWSRVAGDVMDLALLALAARSLGTERSRLGAAGMAVAGVAALDLLSSVQQSRENSAAETGSGSVHVEKSIAVNRSPQECYRYWRDFENFPRFMKHLESVQVLDEVRSRWKAKAPAHTSVEWEAEVTVDQPGQLLAWRALEGDIDNRGTVSFDAAPGGRGTIVRVELEYRPPAGAAGAVLARLFGEEPGQQIDEDLRHFKQLIETGEIATTVNQPSGPRGLFTRFLVRKGLPG